MADGKRKAATRMLCFFIYKSKFQVVANIITAKGSAQMADIRASTPSGAAKAPAKKLASKSNGKKPGTTAVRKTITKAKKPASAKAETAAGKTVTPEERWRMVAEAAYLRAEQRGFSGGNPTDDWLAAEAEIDKILSKP